jgi:preprotein translocase subunit Sss1
LLAAGATRVDDRGAGLLLVGGLGWLLGLVMPLAGYV